MGNLINKEIERLEYFIPKINIKKMISADEAFTQYSERGIKPDFSRIENPYRFYQLQEAKRWQGISIHEMWEQGILDGSVSYWTLLGGESPKEIIPRVIVNFMKKEIFKGKDKDLIEKTYKDILSYWNWWRRLLYFLNNKL
jgi:hypothetical protein